MFSATPENLDTQFIFKHPNLFADPRLGSKKTFGCGRNVQIVSGHFPDIFKLLQLHRPVFMCFGYMPRMDNYFLV
jgi:hypothetical protein